MRLLPQDQDTGGFFVAVLRKIAAPAGAAPAAAPVPVPAAPLAPVPPAVAVAPPLGTPAIPATVTESMIVTKHTEPVMEEKYSYRTYVF